MVERQPPQILDGRVDTAIRLFSHGGSGAAAWPAGRGVIERVRRAHSRRYFYRRCAHHSTSASTLPCMRQSPRTRSNSFCGATFGSLSLCGPSSCSPPAAGSSSSKYVHPCLTARKRASAVANVRSQEMGGGGLWVVALRNETKHVDTLKRNY